MTTIAIKKGTPVTTADGQHLGEAVRLYERQDGANPALKLYAAYLKVRSPELGDQYYVPLEFVAEIDAISGEVNLTLTERQVEAATLSRLPQFVAAGLAQTLELT